MKQMYHLLIFQVFADEGHPEGTPHTEGTVVIDPLLVIVLIIVLAIGGLILWKFVLSEKKPSAQQKTVSRSVDNEVSSQSK